MSKNTSLRTFLPVIFSFFIMGFVDLVGIATNYIKRDFALNDTTANLIPMTVFLWFLVLSVPSGLLMNKIGRKNTVILSNIFTFAAMMLPVISYSFPLLLVSFSLLGIGNTLMQVALNPLLSNIVRGHMLTSSMTLGQFVKAISSFLGPVIAAQATLLWGTWKYIFPAFAFTTILSTIWLIITTIDEGNSRIKSSTFRECFGLLKDQRILLLFLGIICAVGIDVGLNTSLPKFLMAQCHLPLEKAGYGSSMYFIARMLGAFTGAIVLAKISERRFFIVNMIIALIAITVLFFTTTLWMVWFIIFSLGFTIANVFPIIFSAALKRKPNHHNEVSGLLIMGLSGGAFILFIIGIISDATGAQTGGFFILLATIAYLLFIAFRIEKQT